MEWRIQRGVFIFAGPGSLVAHNKFKGNYQDHVHLPSSGVTVLDNSITGGAEYTYAEMGDLVVVVVIFLANWP
ncbi:MAG: hypothetical protein ACC707_14645 [Thiohalomonadales bacterium]